MMVPQVCTSLRQLVVERRVAAAAFETRNCSEHDQSRQKRGLRICHDATPNLAKQGAGPTCATRRLMRKKLHGSSITALQSAGSTLSLENSPGLWRSSAFAFDVDL